MFKSILGLVGDVAKVVNAPVEIALDATCVVTKPVADMATELTKEVKDGLKGLTE